LLSTRERIVSARQWRKRYGAGMRQIGILAAAGHFALDNNISSLPMITAAQNHLPKLRRERFQDLSSQKK